MWKLLLDEADNLTNDRFQKDLIVWKHGKLKGILDAIFKFQKDLIVWKLFSIAIKLAILWTFQKDLIVWKPHYKL